MAAIAMIAADIKTRFIGSSFQSGGCGAPARAPPSRRLATRAGNCRIPDEQRPIGVWGSIQGFDRDRERYFLTAMQP
jgi:hypothetical protein